MKKSELREMIKQELLEAKVISPRDMKNIAQMTDNNDHNGVRVEMAKLIPNKTLITAYEGMEAMNDLFHGMSQDEDVIRRKLDKILKAHMSRKFSNFNDLSW